MKEEKFKVGDSVRVLIVGIDGFYTIDEINEDKVKLSQSYSGMSSRGHYSGKSKSSYKHRLEVTIDKIKKI
tara:strand:+ start:155 stop:367 length:213 start_codon:yes stop_codon:yes gene_type:complete